MASRRRLTLQVTAGMLVFGLLTFLMGLLIGLSSNPPVAAVPPAPLPAETAAAEADAAPAEPVAPAGAAPTAWQEPAPASVSAPEPAVYSAPPVVAAASPTVEKPATPEASVQAPPARPVSPRTAAAAPPVPAKAKAPESQAAGATPAERVQTAAAPPAPPPAPPPAAPAAAEPKRIADIRVGPPPEEQLNSPQRGALVQAASVPAPADVPPPPPAPPLRYAVQVARFLLPENAETLAASLRGRGYQPEIVVSETPATPAAPSWYLVVIDPKGDWKTAERLAIEVATTLGLPGQVVSWPLNP